MNEDIKLKLEARNNAILDAMVKKAEALCPSSIAMIGIVGSFASGDIHEKSDLDALVIINDDNGWKIASCFILGDVAHDIYCTYWGQLEEMAEYNDPYIIKLLNVKFTYCADEKYMEKYMSLREKVLEKLSAPFNDEDIEKAEKHLSIAMQNYARLMLTNDICKCRMNMALMAKELEYTLYMLNKTYVHFGTRRIPQEMAEFKKLPENYLDNVYVMLKSITTDEIKAKALQLLRSVSELIEAEKEKLHSKEEISSDDLKGGYEEIFSNWKNKMYNAATENNLYASFDTMASCQYEYYSYYHDFDIPENRLLADFNPNDLKSNAVAFDKAMERHFELYKKTGTPLCRYETIEEFRKAYLNGIE